MRSELLIIQGHTFYESAILALNAAFGGSSGDGSSSTTKATTADELRAEMLKMMSG